MRRSRVRPTIFDCILEDRCLPSGLVDLHGKVDAPSEKTRHTKIVDDGDVLEAKQDKQLSNLDHSKLTKPEAKALRDLTKPHLRRKEVKGKPPGGGISLLSATPEVTIQATDGAAAELGLDIGEFTITRTASDSDYSAPLTVGYTVSGSAASNSDYWAFTGSLTFYGGLTEGEGVTTQKLLVRPLDDYLVEPTETVIITLSAGPGYTVGAQSSATVAITSNDTSPAQYDMIIPFSNAGPITVEEGGPSGSYTIRLTQAPESNVTINLSTPGPDIQVELVTTQLVFTPYDWGAPKSVSFLAVNDTVNEVSPHPGVIRNTATSDDGRFNGLVKDIQVTVADNEIALDWNPTEADLPSGTYPLSLLGSSPENWAWAESFPNRIREVQIAGPIHDEVPYVGHVDYDGSHGAFSVSVQFLYPGVYTGRVVFDGGVPPVTKFFAVAAWPGGAATFIGRQKKITLPAADAGALLVETPDADNGFIAAAATILPGAKRPATRVAAQNDLLAAWALAGRPIQAVVIGHADDSAFALGAGTTILNNPKPAGKSLFDDNADVIAFGQALNGTIDTIMLFGCNVALNRPARMAHLFPSLSDRLVAVNVNGKVKGYNECVFANAVAPDKRDHYFSVNRGAQLRTSTAGAWTP